MGLCFTKMHGCGNDYIFVDVRAQEISEPESLARRLSDRHFGVGADGLILIAAPSDPRHHARMVMFNADGSRAQMCGNGIRCVGRYLQDRDPARSGHLLIETDAGVKSLDIDLAEDGAAGDITVDMGQPRLKRRDLPMVDGGPAEESAIEQPIDVGGQRILVTAVSMGNPHVVARIDRAGELARGGLAGLAIDEWGPLLENHLWFPERTNVEFVSRRAEGEIDVRVWERGSGETLACGTGACAAVVAGVLGGWCSRSCRVHLRGGTLGIEWLALEKGGRVLLRGPAVEVFSGELAPSALRRGREPVATALS